MSEPSKQPFESNDPLARELDHLVAAFRGLPQTNSRSIRRSIRTIEEVLPDFLTRWKIAETTPQEILLEHWVDIMGNPGLASICQPLRIDTSWKLWIGVGDPVIRQELYFKRAPILKRIKQLPGCGVVRDLRFCPS